MAVILTWVEAGLERDKSSELGTTFWLFSSRSSKKTGFFVCQEGPGKLNIKRRGGKKEIGPKSTLKGERRWIR